MHLLPDLSTVEAKTNFSISFILFWILLLEDFIVRNYIFNTQEVKNDLTAHPQQIYLYLLYSDLQNNNRLYYDTCKDRESKLFDSSG